MLIYIKEGENLNMSQNELRITACKEVLLEPLELKKNKTDYPYLVNTL